MANLGVNYSNATNISVNDQSNPGVSFVHDRLIKLVAVEGPLALLIFLLFLYLSIRLRKRAWNTTSKRFSRFFQIFFLLLYFVSFIFTIFCLCTEDEVCSCPIGSFLPRVLFFVSTDFCISVSVAALLLQVTFPWVPERMKRYLRSSVVKSSKRIFEVMALLLIVAYNIFWLITLILRVSHRISCEHSLNFKVLCYISLSITSITVSFNAFSIIILSIAFCAAKRSPTFTKKHLIKFLSLTAVITFDCSVSIILFFIHILHKLDVVELKNSTLFNSLLGVNIVSIFIFLLVTTVLNYERDVWCCCCACLFSRSKGSSETPPLLNATNEQNTNPASIRRNDPSFTKYSPVEMSDCKSTTATDM